ncbi:MAG: cysteine desulfurase family protein [Pirellulaceae bacterium]
MQAIYLDNNSTTQLDPEVADAMRDCQLARLGNPASQHGWGRQARRLLEDAREDIAAMLGARSGYADADRLIFTSGGTESNNLALRGLAGVPPSRLLLSAIEHPSVLATAEWLAAAGHRVEYVPVATTGTLAVDRLPRDDTPPPRLISVMLANHETGVLQPLVDVVAWAAERGCLVHTDAVQAVGKGHVHFRDLGVDSLSFAAHKFHGPVGIGGLLVRQSVSLDPILFGGFQQLGIRPGTEAVALAVGMQVALRKAFLEAAERQERMQRLRDRLAAQLRSADAMVQGTAAERLPHTLNVAFPGVDRQALVMALDLAGVACSTGSACASGSSEPSPVLLAMGQPAEVIQGAIRLSLSARTTSDEVDEAARRILGIVNDLRQRRPVIHSPLPPRLSSPEPI